MKAFKRMALTLGSSAAVLSLALTFYNSAALNNDSFMSAKLDLNNKRLDELNGEVVIGRMAASTRSWDSLEIEQKEDITLPVKTLKVVETTSFKKKVEELSPAITADLELSLTAVKLGSKEEGKPTKLTELKKGSFSGSARTSNGIVEEVVVNLPDGRTIDIYSSREMASNVFEYMDEETGETRSAMMYESAKDTFTVMLTNDPHYPGTRLDFKTNGEGFGNDSNLNWGMNDQNINSELAEGESYENNNQENENTEYVQDENVEAQDDFSFQFNS